MKKKLFDRLGYLVLGVVGTGVFVGGCAKSAPDAGTSNSKRGRFVFITNSDSTYWDAAEKGFSDACKDQNLQGTFLRNKSGDAQGQIRLLEQTLVQSDVRGVAISVIEASAVGIVDKLEELQEKGVAVVTVDSDCAEKHRKARTAYIGTNNVDAGKVAGTIAKLLLPEGGKVVGFVGSMDADNAQQRVGGFKEATAGGIVVAEVMEDANDRSKARQNVEAALLKHKDLAMPFGIWSYNAPAIAEVVTEAGKRDSLKILTFDAEEETMKLIAKGAIDATIVQNTFDMGYVSATLLAALARKDTALAQSLLKGTDLHDTGVRVIVPDGSPLLGKDPRVESVVEFEKYMQSKGLKST